jgi:hypothetical protein
MTTFNDLLTDATSALTEIADSNTALRTAIEALQSTAQVDANEATLRTTLIANEADFTAANFRQYLVIGDDLTITLPTISEGNGLIRLVSPSTNTVSSTIVPTGGVTIDDDELTPNNDRLIVFDRVSSTWSVVGGEAGGWQSVTSDIELVAGGKYRVSAGLTLTLPATPTAGDIIELFGDFSTAPTSVGEKVFSGRDRALVHYTGSDWLFYVSSNAVSTGSSSATFTQLMSWNAGVSSTSTAASAATNWKDRPVLSVDRATGKGVLTIDSQNYLTSAAANFAPLSKISQFQSATQNNCLACGFGKGILQSYLTPGIVDLTSGAIIMSPVLATVTLMLDAVVVSAEYGFMAWGTTPVLDLYGYRINLTTGATDIIALPVSVKDTLRCGNQMVANDTHVYISGTNTIVKYNIQSLSDDGLISSIAEGIHGGLAIHTGSKRLYVAGADDITIFETDTDTLVSQMSIDGLGLEIRAIEVSADGKILFAMSHLGTLAFDTTTFDVIGMMHTPWLNTEVAVQSGARLQIDDSRKWLISHMSSPISLYTVPTPSEFFYSNIVQVYAY